MGVPSRCAVTGGSGFVGRRLVEMLIDRGATHVVSFDVAPKPTKWIDPKYDDRITYVQVCVRACRTAAAPPAKPLTRRCADGRTGCCTSQGDLVNKQTVVDAFKVRGSARVGVLGALAPRFQEAGGGGVACPNSKAPHRQHAGISSPATCGPGVPGMKPG
jgi:hypothetical protein